MGDRCYLEMYFRKGDEGKVREALGLGDNFELAEAGTDVAPKGGVLAFVDEEANYALQDAREKLAAAGVAFVGSHGPGDEYDGGRFAACGGKLRDVTVDRGGNMVAAVDGKGSVNARDLRDIRLYCALRKRAEKAIGFKWRNG
jgi:hypothetical protein